MARIGAGWLISVMVFGLAGVACAGEGAGDDTLPLWEVGLFNTVSRVPDYRGSGEYTTYIIPFPYFIYRGEIMRLNRGGVKAVYLQTEHLQADVSFSGNPPVRNNEARSGMPDRDAIGEVGPALRWLFMPRGSPKMLYLQASVRGAFSIDWDGGPQVECEGMYGGIRLTGFDRMTQTEGGWGYGFSVGFDLSDSTYNDFFYGVDEEYARADRPAFHSEGGYAGAWISANVSKRISRNLSFATFVKWDNLDGAAFEDSPLVKDRNSVIVACALTWTVATSSRARIRDR